jgi:hypothetical protein
VFRRLYIRRRLHLRDTTLTPHLKPALKPETAPSGKGKHMVMALNLHTRNKQKLPYVKGVALPTGYGTPATPTRVSKTCPRIPDQHGESLPVG